MPSLDIGDTSDVVSDVIRSAIRQRVFPGVVVGTVTACGTVSVVSSGRFDYESGRPMFPDAIFDVASITKSIPVACLCLRLADEGLLSVEDRLRRFIPELHHQEAEEMTIRHLLTHTVDFGFSLSSLKDCPPHEILNAIFNRGLRSKPGTSYQYTNAASVLLGLVIERAAAQPLDELADNRFFRPLAMSRTSFTPSTFNIKEIVPTENDPWRGRVIVGEVHDESAWKLRAIMIPGSAGLFSTAPDLLKFLHVVLNDGRSDHGRLFSRDAVTMMFTDQTRSLAVSAGMGWELNQPRFMGAFSNDVIGKTGFTGCCVMASRHKGLGLVILSNYSFPVRKPNSVLIDEFRRTIADMIFR